MLFSLDDTTTEVKFMIFTAILTITTEILPLFFTLPPLIMLASFGEILLNNLSF